MKSVPIGYSNDNKRSNHFKINFSDSGKYPEYSQFNKLKFKTLFSEYLHKLITMYDIVSISDNSYQSYILFKRSILPGALKGPSRDLMSTALTAK